MTILLPTLEHPAPWAACPITDSRKTLNKGTLGFAEFLSRLPVVARGINRLSVSGRIAPPIFGRGVRRLRSSDASQFVSDEGREELISDATALNLAKGMGAKGQFVPAPLALFEGHTHKSLPHELDRSPVMFSAEKKMSLVSRIAERFSKRLKRIVEKERQAIGCGTTAVKRVASKLKLSPVTIYRAMNNYGSVQIKAHHYAALLMLSLGSSKVAAKFRRNSIAA